MCGEKGELLSYRSLYKVNSCYSYWETCVSGVLFLFKLFKFFKRNVESWLARMGVVGIDQESVLEAFLVGCWRSRPGRLELICCGGCCATLSREG